MSLMRGENSGRILIQIFRAISDCLAEDAKEQLETAREVVNIVEKYLNLII